MRSLKIPAWTVSLVLIFACTYLFFLNLEFAFNAVLPAYIICKFFVFVAKRGPFRGLNLGSFDPIFLQFHQYGVTAPVDIK